MKILFVVLMLLIVPQAFAELTQCDGVWTNKSCSEQANSEQAKKAAPEEKALDSKMIKERSFKKSLFHDLNMKNIKANNSYEIKLDLSQAEDVCNSENSTIDECRKQIKEIDTLLDEKIKVAVELETKKKALKLQEEANKIQEQRNDIEKNKPSTIIIQKGNIIIPRDYLRPKERGTTIKIEAKGDNTKVELEAKPTSDKEDKKIKQQHTTAAILR